MNRLPEPLETAGTSGAAADFFRAAAEFAAVQQEQGEALAAGQVRDILSWMTLRERVFRDLARFLERLLDEGRENETLLSHARERVGDLLENERKLAVAAGVGKSRLKERQQSMRRGREALHGYGAHDGAASRSRYLSSRM